MCHTMCAAHCTAHCATSCRTTTHHLLPVVPLYVMLQYTAAHCIVIIAAMCCVAADALLCVVSPWHCCELLWLEKSIAIANKTRVESPI